MSKNQKYWSNKTITNIFMWARTCQSWSIYCTLMVLSLFFIMQIFNFRYTQTQYNSVMNTSLQTQLQWLSLTNILISPIHLKFSFNSSVSKQTLTYIWPKICWYGYLAYSFKHSHNISLKALNKILNNSLIFYSVQLHFSLIISNRSLMGLFKSESIQGPNIVFSYNCLFKSLLISNI